MDRAALDAALAAGLACGGWCPRGRRAEDGSIPARYPLRETPGRDYRERTHWNVRDADATLILTRGSPRGGTALAGRWARDLGRPLLVVDPWQPGARARIVPWLRREQIRSLNVAGPRESQQPGIYAAALGLLESLLESPGGERPRE